MFIICCIFSFRDTAATNAMDQAVFVQPYQTQDSSSHAAELTTNTQLRDEVERLRQRMRTEKECLIHGNLNTNAVVFKDGKPKVGRIRVLFLSFVEILAQFNIYSSTQWDVTFHPDKHLVAITMWGCRFTHVSIPTMEIRRSYDCLLGSSVPGKKAFI